MTKIAKFSLLLKIAIDCFIQPSVLPQQNLPGQESLWRLVTSNRLVPTE